jgi:hypothetical protein
MGATEELPGEPRVISAWLDEGVHHVPLQRQHHGNFEAKKLGGTGMTPPLWPARLDHTHLVLFPPHDQRLTTNTELGGAKKWR